MTQNELMDVWPWTHSWRILYLLECSNRSGYFYTNYNVVYVAIFILLHSWCSGADPTSEWAKLNGIWFMTTHYSEFRQLLLHIFANDSCFNASDHVILVNPFNFIHPGDIHWHNSPLLFRLAHEWFSDICSTSEWNKYDIVFFCCLNQIFSLLVGNNIDDVICSPGQLRISQ